MGTVVIDQHGLDHEVEAALVGKIKLVLEVDGDARLEDLVAANIRVWVCDTCMGSLGLADSDLIAGSRRANIAELGRAVLEADKFITW